jgi:hypothetical protein
MLVAVSCAVIGAGASAIASAGASTGTTGTTAKTAHQHALRAGGLRRWATRAVQGNLVVKTKAGFVAVTFERGTVQSVAGQQLTMTEGTKTASYKTVILTIPSNALIRDDRQKATLSDLKPGQRVIVVTAPKRTFVVARTPKTA